MTSALCQPTLRPSEVIRLRRHDWLRDYEEGRWDPLTRRVARRSVKRIAQLAGVSEETVRQGIILARRDEELVRSVRESDEY